MRKLSILLLLAALPAAPVFGQLVAIGQNTGVVTTFNAATLGQDLIITVDNTTAGLGGVTGSMTSFGFNTPWTAPLDLSKVALSYQVLSATGPTTGWNPLSTFGLNAGGLQATVDLGAESDANGNPNGNSVANGVQFGEIVAFKFSFLDPYVIPEFDDISEFFNQDPTGFDFLVRWQGIQVDGIGDGSDAYGGDWPGGYDIPQGPVPEPSTYGLLAVIAMLTLIGNRIPRRRSGE